MRDFIDRGVVRQIRLDGEEVGRFSLLTGARRNGRADARPAEVLNAVFDLFVELDANDATLDFPTIYASGREGIATTDLALPATDLLPLFDAILKHVPPPEVDPSAPLQMLVVKWHARQH